MGGLSQKARRRRSSPVEARPHRRGHRFAGALGVRASFVAAVSAAGLVLLGAARRRLTE